MRMLSAPGKAFLVGEYAVLDGAPALVVAVNRRVVLRPGPGEPEGLVAKARSRVAHLLGRHDLDPCAWVADSTALAEDGRKLGLGSSAAVALLGVASAWREAGRSLEDEGECLSLWRVAREVHEAHQGEPGSGADLAACLFGGIRSFRPGISGGLPGIREWRLPPGLRLRFAWTGVSAHTPTLVAAVRRARREDPSTVDAILAEMGRLAEACVDRGSREARTLLEGLHAYGLAMARLGQAARVPLVGPGIATLAATVRDLGGAAKPSGAGGGDLVVAVLPESVEDTAWVRAVMQVGFFPLVLEAADRGLS